MTPIHARGHGPGAYLPSKEKTDGRACNNMNSSNWMTSGFKNPMIKAAGNQEEARNGLWLRKSNFQLYMRRSSLDYITVANIFKGTNLQSQKTLLLHLVEESYSTANLWNMASPSTMMTFKLFLLVHEIENLAIDNSADCSKRSLMIRIEWRRRGRKIGPLQQGLKKSCTSKQPIRSNGTVTWNEGFNHICKLERTKSQGYKSWIVNLEVQEFDTDSNSKGKSPVIVMGETNIDISEYAPPNCQRRIRTPIRCNINDQTVFLLKAKLHFVEVSAKGRMGFTLPRALSIGAISCVGMPQGRTSEFPTNPSVYPSLADSSSDDEPELTYNKIATSNILLSVSLPDEDEDFKDYGEKEQHNQRSVDRVKRQSHVVRLLANKLSFKSKRQPKGEPLLSKACSDVGGDDIDIERHKHTSGATFSQTYDRRESHGFEDEAPFEVGAWENRRLVSRDAEMELATDVFLASIDQRSEKTSGGSACTVLAVVIADWLHNNPKSLPLRCQLDELIHQGSFEWRNLCEDEAHKARFSDQHFDLDTVLESNIRPLREINTKSYMGFFNHSDMPEILPFLQDMESFDKIWEELILDSSLEQRIFIASWNDHFFTLKVEKEAIFLIDTLGERLFEGCDQAYMLKFDEKSVIYKRSGGANVQTGDGSSECKQGTQICIGIGCCKEYMKGFLAALPLRELQEDVKRKGVMDESILHRRLQIEFHFTAPTIEEP